MLSSAVTLSPQTEYAKEVCKWEAQHTQYGPPGRPYQYHPYPTMLYKASRDGMGVLSFDSRIAHDDAERAIAEGQGYVWGGQAAALEALERQQFAAAEAEAEINYEIRRMGEKARAEANAHLESTANHISEIPVTPIKRRGRPKKAEPVTA